MNPRLFVLLLALAGFLPTALVYFLPTLVAWRRDRKGKDLAYPVKVIFLINLLLGWTVVMWLVAMWFALGGAEARFAAGGGAPGPSPGPSPGPLPDAGGAPMQGMRLCGACGGNGRVMCSSCGGRGSWYDPPQGASGVAQLRTCPACAASGRVTCISCGGSGRVW